jgi:hypothetical protein
MLQITRKNALYVTAGVDKTKNNSGASIFFLQIRAKKTMNQTKKELYILKCALKFRHQVKILRRHGDRAPCIGLLLCHSITFHILVLQWDIDCIIPSGSLSIKDSLLLGSSLTVLYRNCLSSPYGWCKCHHDSKHTSTMKNRFDVIPTAAESVGQWNMK